MVQEKTIEELQLTPDSPIWVYQSSTLLSEEQVNHIHTKLTQFISSWQSHGNALAGDFTIVSNRFIILGVNNSQATASGCSIDSSVHIIQELEKDLSISLLDKSHVAFETTEGIQMVDFRKIKDAIASQVITKDSFVFNNQVNTYLALLNNWKVSIDKSWVDRFFR
ncbi:MAG: hypothetical protein AB8B61_01840 [Cyclobacteriaceae bacterium]